METVRIIFPMFVGPIRIKAPRYGRGARKAERAAVADFHERKRHLEPERLWEKRAAGRERYVKVGVKREERRKEREGKES